MCVRFWASGERCEAVTSWFVASLGAGRMNGARQSSSLGQIIKTSDLFLRLMACGVADIAEPRDETLKVSYRRTVGDRLDS